jgi:hypothetical protein
MDRADSDRTVMVRAPTDSIDQFERLAARASDAGATHLYVSDLPKPWWRRERDRDDPYPTWAMRLHSVFEVSTPPALEEYVPQDYVRENREILARRADVLEEYGLTPAFRGYGPAYLPEEAFREHPEWRGPRVEQPRRAKSTYYAPCIDQEEVLDMYRDAVADICSLVPVDYFSLITNDSGAGLCWSGGLYPGRNGPEWCRDRPMADRVEGFLSTLQAGARDAGVDATVNLRYGVGTMPEQEVTSVLPSLDSGQHVNWTASDGTEPTATVGFNRLESGVNPVVGVPQAFRLARELEEAFSSDSPRVDVAMLAADDPTYFDLIEAFDGTGDGNGVQDAADRLALLNEIATARVGPDHAPDLLTLWEHVDAAVDAVRKIGPDPITLVGVVNQRWLTRPFVPFPLELDPAETAYYRDYQFQANSAAEAADLMNLQGFEMVNGYSGSLLATTLLEEAIEHVEAATDRAESLAGALSGDDAEEFERLASRLRALDCVYTTIENAVRYQEILDRTDYEQRPREDNIWPVEGDQRLREIQNVTRSEVDNSVELAEVVESTDAPVLDLADTPEEEWIFQYGPDVVEHLEKKVALTLDHQWDLHRLYERRQW